MARKPSVTEEQKAEIISDVKRGMTVAEAAKKHKVSVPSVYLYVRGKKTGKKKAAKKAAKKASRKVAPSKDTVTGDFTSIMRDLQDYQRLKAFLAELGFRKD